MANQEHVDILRQGVEIWNAWREEHPDVRPDLSSMDFFDRELIEANLDCANLSSVDLSGTHLSLISLKGADLRRANLSGAFLIEADFTDADLTNADLTDATIGKTVLGDRDLRVIKGLETIKHEGPSPLSIKTIDLSESDIPEKFMRGTGNFEAFEKQKHSNQENIKLMSKSEDPDKYQINNNGTVQSQVIGDHNITHQYFYGSSTPLEDKSMQKIKALFLMANPTSTPRLAIDEEMRAIEQKVRAAQHRDALVFQSAWAVRPDDLLKQLNQHQPHIVHFSGHGSGKGLCLAGENGQERVVTAPALKSLFTTLKDNIRLVFLNACYSREQALALVETIDCVIGMKESIRDDAAIAFASSFYRAIGFGRSVQEAFDQGITSLLLEGIPQEDIPELLVKQGVEANKIHLMAPANPQ